MKKQVKSCEPEGALPPQFPSMLPLPRAMVNTGGNSNLYTPQLAAGIVYLLYKGNYFQTACTAYGISHRTVREWLRQGAKGVEPFATFLRAVEMAHALAETNLVERIREASKKEWQAGAWLLERKSPERWARKERDVDSDFRSQGKQQDARINIMNIITDKSQLESLQSMLMNFADNGNNGKIEIENVA